MLFFKITKKNTKNEVLTDIKFLFMNFDKLFWNEILIFMMKDNYYLI